MPIARGLLATVDQWAETIQRDPEKGWMDQLYRELSLSVKMQGVWAFGEWVGYVYGLERLRRSRESCCISMFCFAYDGRDLAITLEQYLEWAAQEMRNFRVPISTDEIVSAGKKEEFALVVGRYSTENIERVLKELAAKGVVPVAIFCARGPDSVGMFRTHNGNEIPVFCGDRFETAASVH